MVRLSDSWGGILLRFLIVVLFFVIPVQLRADCHTVWTWAGYEIVCDDTETEGVTASYGHDSIEVQSGATVSSTDSITDTSSVEVETQAIDSEMGNDTITNLGSVQATATGSSTTENRSIHVTSDAQGIAADSGNDEVLNSGSLSASAQSVLEGSAISLDADSFLDVLYGRLLAGGKLTGESCSYGLILGSGDDTLSNSGTISSQADTSVSNFGVTLNLLNSSVAFGGAKTTAEAFAVGVDAGSGGDVINHESGAVSATATSNALGEITADFSGFFSKAYISTDSQAWATGIDGAEGADSISVGSQASIEASAQSSASSTMDLDVEALISSCLNIGITLAEADTSATSIASGISAGSNNDEVINAGSVTADAVSDASTAASIDTVLAVENSLSINGVFLNSSAISNSTATAVSADEGQDSVNNSGELKAQATSSAKSSSVHVGVEKAENFYTVGISYINTYTNACAQATGIDGGSGSDALINESGGTIRINAASESLSVSTDVAVSASFSNLLGGSIDGVVTTASSISGAYATGIDTGDATNTFTNYGSLITQADSSAASQALNIALSGVASGLTLGVTCIDTLTYAEAQATGVLGGAGVDTLVNEGSNTVSANAAAASELIDVSISGTMQGAVLSAGLTLSDDTTESAALAYGIKGEAGDDNITNSGAISINANSISRSESVSVDLGSTATALGLVGGFSYANADTVAEALIVGMDGGSGDDVLTNTATISATAEPDASSSSVVFSAQNITGTGASADVSLSTGSTKASATVTGMNGGSGDDSLNNAGIIEVQALPAANSSLVDIGISTSTAGVQAGGSLIVTQTAAQAIATGMNGGTGEDSLGNTGTIISTATAQSSGSKVAASFDGALTGADADISLANGSVEALSQATGMDGGMCDDILSNSGEIYVYATSLAIATGVSMDLSATGLGLSTGVSLISGNNNAGSLAEGMSGGDGDDTISNYLSIFASAGTNSSRGEISLSGSFSLLGGSLETSLVNAANTATAESVCIDGGQGDDIIINAATLTALSNISASTSSVSVDLNIGLALDTSFTNAQTTGESIATGIFGGEGDDQIANSEDGTIYATSTAQASTSAISVGSSISISSTTASTQAIADSYGIDGGTGQDAIVNNGRINPSATATLDATSTTVRLIGLSYTDADAAAIAQATGLYGSDGDDSLLNSSTGNITGTATALADAGSYNVQMAGVGVTSAGTAAQALATGMNGGAGDDHVRNEGNINLSSNAKSDATSASITIVGANGAAADGEVLAQITGLEGSDGDDVLVNAGTGVIAGTATAEATAGSYTITPLGVDLVTAQTVVEAAAFGISGGANDDTVYNNGLIYQGAIAGVDASSASVEILGLSYASAGSEANAVMTGLEGSDGDDTLVNSEAGIIKGYTKANAQAGSYNIQLAGASAASANTTANASTVGISGGAGDDALNNEGSIDLSAEAQTDASSASLTLAGLGGVSAGSVVLAQVSGLEGSEGDDTLVNSASGAITGIAKAEAVAGSCSLNLAGDEQVTVDTTAQAIAYGINAGADDDTVYNEGSIDLSAKASVNATASSVQIAGLSNASAGAVAFAQVTGLEGSDGDDTLINAQTGSISGFAKAEAKAGSYNFQLAGSSNVSAGTGANASALGISGGTGSDMICNQGSISLQAQARLDSNSESFVVAGAQLASALGDASASATGIAGGEGDDSISNASTGTIALSAESLASASSTSFTIFGGTSGSSYLGSTVTLTGIDGGDGNDTIYNYGTISMSDIDGDGWMAEGTAEGVVGTFVGTGSTTNGASAQAVSIGINGGLGDDTLVNEQGASLNVLASSYAVSEGTGQIDTFGDTTAVASTATEADATGISGGDGDDIIINSGELSVTSNTRACAHGKAEVGWGNPRSESYAKATATAQGIDAGSGANIVINDASLEAIATALASPYAYSDSDVDRTYATTQADAYATAYGIITGDDSDIVENSGSGVITVTAQAMTDHYGEDYVRSDENATAKADSYQTPVSSAACGISLGDGENQAANYGTISVTAKSSPQTNTHTDSSLYSTKSVSNSYAQSSATGIAGGDDADTILNAGNLEVSAISDSESYARAKTGIVGADAKAYAVSWADSTAVGIDAGDGDDVIINSGTITVDALAKAYAYSYANDYSGSDRNEYTDASAVSSAQAYGIRAVSGDNSIINNGDISVSARAYATGEQAAEDKNTSYDGTISVSVTGIWTGDGDDVIENIGSISAIASDSAIISVNAQYYGIYAGDGANMIINRGAITADSSSALTLNTEAYGIVTGSDDDIIMNTGAITATAQNLFLQDSGQAIVSGAGNDTVILVEGSSTTGTINLGAGDDILRFSSVDETNVISMNGYMYGGSGSDTLLFDGAGTLGDTVLTFSSFETARKECSGLFYVKNLPTMTNLLVNKGTLEIGSDYSMGSDSLFQSTIYAGGSNGQLKVDGVLSLAGDLSVIKGSGLFLNNITYEIITADTVNNSFSTVSLPDPGIFVSFAMEQTSDSVLVTTQVKDFTTQASTAVEESVAVYLDSIAASVATSDDSSMAMLLGQVQGLSSDEYARALSSMSPYSYNTLRVANIAIADQSVGMVQTRMDTVRNHQYALEARQKQDVLLAYAGSDLGQLFSREQALNGLWLDAGRQWGNEDEEDGFAGYDFTVNGITIGYDRKLSDLLTLGISASYARADVDFDNNEVQSSIDSYLASLYGSYFDGNISVDGVLSYGGNSYDNDRLVTIGPSQGVASSDHDGDLLSAYLKAGYHFKARGYQFQPFAGLQYIALDEEGFTEEGAGSLNLVVDNNRTDSLVSDLGCGISRILMFGNASLIPELSLSWLHDFDIDENIVTTAFADMSGTTFTTDLPDMSASTFTTKGRKTKKNGATLGAGITFLHKNGISSFLKYRGELRDGYVSHGILGEFRYAF